LNSGELSQFTNHWYVTAGDGDVVVRVFPGMSLGETETGELSLEGSDALLSLSIGSDESLVVFVVNGGELESEDGEFCGKRHLAFDSAGLIRLPNHILRFDKDILTATDAKLLPLAVWRTVGAENRTPTANPIGTTPQPPVPKHHAAEHSAPKLKATEPKAPEPSALEPKAPEASAPQPSAIEPSASETIAPKAKAPEPIASEPATPEFVASEPIAPKPIAPDPVTPEPRLSKRDEPQSIADTTELPIPHKVPIKAPARPKPRQRAIVASALVGLLCVLIGLVYSGTRTDVTPEQPAPIVRQVVVEETSRQTAVQTPVDETPKVALPDLDQTLAKSISTPAPIATPERATPEKTTPAIARPTTAAPITTTPKTAAPEKTVVIATPPKEVRADEKASTPAVAAAKPLSQNRPKLKEPTIAAPSNTTATPKNTRSRPTSQAPVSRREVARANPAPAAAAAAADAQYQREQEQAQAALVRYERDLLAAELALVQGRLTQPPGDSAFTLYKRLVASNPESSEASRGLQAVGAALVNRAFAELAAKRWGDARATLTAAAEAGASPNLIANLSGEVAYQQRLADAEAGRFDALYPAAELVALDRTTPRLRRYAPDDLDMVQIEFTISIAGNVQDIEVLGAPPQRLERVVRQAVTDWRFEPVLSGTRPIPVRTRVGLEIP